MKRRSVHPGRAYHEVSGSASCVISQLGSPDSRCVSSRLACEGHRGHDSRPTGRSATILTQPPRLVTRVPGIVRPSPVSTTNADQLQPLARPAEAEFAISTTLAPSDGLSEPYPGASLDGEFEERQTLPGTRAYGTLGRLDLVGTTPSNCSQCQGKAQGQRERHESPDRHRGDRQRQEL